MALLVHTIVRPVSGRMLFAASRATTVACVVAPSTRFESGAVTLTEATDGADTVSPNVAGPTPSTVTPIVALPAATALIRPDEETVATPVALLVHTIVRPVSGRMLFAASRATTVPCVLLPVVRLESGALTLTDATGTAVTVSRNVAGPTPSTVTPIVLLPGETALISPDEETVATPVALLVHTIVRPVSGRMLLAASRATTVACVVAPSTRLESGAVTLTEATDGADTVSPNVAGPTPSTVTPIVALPAATALIRPDEETVATPVALLVHTIVRPVSGRMLFAASRATTVACVGVASR